MPCCSLCGLPCPVAAARRLGCTLCSAGRLPPCRGPGRATGQPAWSPLCLVMALKVACTAPLPMRAQQPAAVRRGPTFEWWPSRQMELSWLQALPPQHLCMKVSVCAASQGGHVQQVGGAASCCCCAPPLLPAQRCLLSSRTSPRVLNVGIHQYGMQDSSWHRPFGRAPAPGCWARPPTCAVRSRVRTKPPQYSCFQVRSIMRLCCPACGGLQLAPKPSLSPLSSAVSRHLLWAEQRQHYS